MTSDGWMHIMDRRMDAIYRSYMHVKEECMHVMDRWMGGWMHVMDGCMHFMYDVMERCM